MFGNFFKKSEESKLELGRIALTDEKQIEELIALSKLKPVLLFKHSTRCGISSMVLKRFESKIKKSENVFGYYYLELLQYRNISNFIVQKFNIPHQSPQLIVIKNGTVVDYNSHYGIMDVEV